MKYSIIFSYRDREEHAKITLPRIKEVFKDNQYEVIVVEQNNDKKFRRGNLLNEGARVASGDILIFSDIDYYPTDDVQYWDGRSEIFLPVKYVDFVYNDLTPKPIHEVPGGYRHFKDGVDDNFHGAVITFTKEAFVCINGFSPKFVGWGIEDGDLRNRIAHYKITSVRSETNRFLALDHKDSGPSANDKDFLNNIRLEHQWQFYLPHGLDNQPSTSEIVAPPEWANNLVDKWVKATDFDPPVLSQVIKSSFNFDEGDE